MNSSIPIDPNVLLMVAGLLALLVVASFVWSRKRHGQKDTSGPSFQSSFKGLQRENIESTQATTAGEVQPDRTPQQSSWWSALSKTRERFFRVESKEVTAIKEALEEACLISDLGVGNTQEAMNAVDWTKLSETPENERLSFAKLRLAQVIRPWLEKSSTQDSLTWLDSLESSKSGPRVIWFVGVNGVGKTTSIAKLASELKKRGKSVLLAAGDTFRAAAGEQLEIWAQRLNIPCIRGQAGADSSAVIFDALESAKAKNLDYVLCDSAGRLHNQNQLMEALQKNRRVIEKAIPGAPHEVLLVLDANTGQNMLNQAEQFIKAVQVTGLILTKLDGTARGGAIIAVARKTSLPIRRLGLGESAEDFVPFDAERFSEALLGTKEQGL